jgi:hypothetical protein
LSASFPPLPPELVTFTEGGVSILVGTCTRDLQPETMRGMGMRVWPGASQLTVLLPAATGARSIANLRDNPRIAITIAHIPSHKTIQIKGNVLAIRDGDEEDRKLATRYRERFSDDLAFVGQPPANTLRLGIWPCHAVDVDITVVYAQTPGPIAGAKMPLSAGRL